LSYQRKLGTGKNRFVLPFAFAFKISLELACVFNRPH
jgi:hypothetical protein